MKLLVHFFQTRVFHVRIDLRRLNARVAEHFLDLPQIRAASE